MHWASRSLPRGVRHVRAVQLIAAAARRADVVYSTGMLGRSALGSALGARADRPEADRRTPPTSARSATGCTAATSTRSSARGGAAGARASLGAEPRAARAARSSVPSESLGGLAAAWGIRPERIEVLPNPVARPASLEDRDELRRRLGLDGPTLVFAGRLSVQKAVDVALEALTRLDGLDLVLAGDGPDAENARALAGELGLDGRARFLGPQPRERVLELFRAGDAVAAPVELGELPARARRGACGRHARDRDRGRRRDGDRPGRRERAARPARGPGGARRGDPALLRRRRAARAAPRGRGRHRSSVAPERIYRRLEELLRETAAA